MKSAKMLYICTLDNVCKSREKMKITHNKGIDCSTANYIAMKKKINAPFDQ